MTQAEIRNEVNLFRQYILAKHNSQNTADAYCPAVAAFLTHFRKRPKDITAPEIINYLTNVVNLNTRRNVHSAIKKYFISKSKYGIVNKFRYIPYPERPETLPNPITKEEFVAIIQACANLKHRCILMLAFDCGLRVSEVINLKINDLDFHKMQVRVVQSKGRVDRLLKLTTVLANFITQYLQEYNPQEYLFNGQNNEPQYSVRSCQEILKKNGIKAGINRPVKFHENRHGFAQSLLENGTGLERIQDLLGHKSAKTTRIYAKMNNKVIQQTQSPLEQILQETNGKFLNSNNKIGLLKN